MPIKAFLLYFFVASTWCVISTGRLTAQTSRALPATFVELPDPHAGSSDWSGLDQSLHSSFVTIDKRYPKSELPKIKEQREWKVTGWKGEVLSAQVLLWTKQATPGVRVQVSDFVDVRNRQVVDLAVEARFVRYVMTDEFAEGCGHRKPEDFASSLSPDLLDDLDQFDIPARTARPVWLTVPIPKHLDAGTYRAEIQVLVGTDVVDTLVLELDVIDHLLPEPKEWTYHLDQWQHPAAVARVEGVPVWSDAHFEAMQAVMQLLADAGQKVITTTLNKDPWNVQTYDPYEDMIVWTKHADGSWSYDYTVFDRWVNFMMDLGIQDMINCYSLLPWNNEVHYLDESHGEYVTLSAKPGTANFKAVWMPFLMDFVKHLEANNWLEITNIAMDEREREQMDAAIALLNDVAPELGVSYADNQQTYQRYPDSDDISISVGHPFSKADLLDRQHRGLNTTFYICCSDAFPNQFTFSEPAESTYLAWYALANGFDGMLRWAYNSWVENPLQDSRFRTWPAGDTYIVYPKGRSSIRYERLREGIQDYEKTRIVLTLLQEQGKESEWKLLNAAIDKLSANQRHELWNQYLNDAKALVNELSRTL